MAGIIHWLAPHMGYTPPGGAPAAPAATPADTIPDFMRQAQASGALTTPQAATGIVGPAAGAGAAPIGPMGGAAPSAVPGATQQALQAMWARHFAPPTQAPQVSMTPVPGSAIYPGQRSSGGLPPLSAPGHPLHPQSVRVDFHAPPSPADHVDALNQLRFLHPGIGSSGPAAQAGASGVTEPWLLRGGGSP